MAAFLDRVARARGFLGIVLAGWGVAISVSPSRADTFTWDGGGADSYWQTAANWSGDTAPGSDGSATLAFAGATRTSAANNYAADTVFAGINLLNDYTTGKTAGFTLSGNRITLGGNIVSTAASSSITDTFSLPILLSGPRTLTMNSNHHLTISGVIGETGGSFSLTKAGAGTLRLTGANTFTGPVTNSNSGYLYYNSIKDIGGGASALGAPTTVENGTISATGRLFYNGSSSAATDRSFVVLTGDLQFYNDTSGTTLTLNGAITGSGTTISFRGAGTIVINGLVSLGTVARTDSGTVYLNNAANAFSGTLTVKDGIISTDTIADGGQPCAYGLGTQIALGQNSPYNTTGTFQFTGAAGGSCNRTIRIYSANSGSYGGKIENTVAGQTLTLSGSVVADSGASKPAPVWLTGAGDGVLSGPVDAGIRIVKTGSGTWTLSGANANTGSVVVSSGTLLVNSSLRAESAVSVAAGATFGGTGTVSGLVAVAAGGILSPGVNDVGTLTLANSGGSALSLTGAVYACEVTGAGQADRLDVAGALVLNGATVIALQLPDGTAPAGIYTLATYASLDDTNGSITLDRTYPNATLDVGETGVTLTIVGSGITPTLLWQGDGAANLWDYSANNWTPSTFADGMFVVFDDTGSDTPVVNIAAAGVAPGAVTVDGDAKNYTFVGGSLTCSDGLTKSGASLLTLNNASVFGAVALNGGALTVNGALGSSGIAVAAGTVLTQGVGAVLSGAGAVLDVSGTAVLLGDSAYTGATTVETGGSLTLDGTLDGSSIAVGTNAFFSQGSASVIAGATATVTLQSNASLSGTNTYDGETVLGILGTPNLAYYVNSSNALGSTVGGTRIYGGNGSLLSRLYLAKNLTVAGETLTLSGDNSYRAGLAYSQSGGTGTWAGAIACVGAAYIESSTAGGTLAIGTDDTTVVTNAASASLSMRGNGTIALNSRVNLGTGNSLLRNDGGVLVVNSTNNIWGGTGFSEGTIRLGVSNGLPPTTTLTIGKSDKKALCVFDLNGYDQIVSGLADVHYAGPNDHTGTQRILSDTPATLTVSNNTARSFGLEGSSIEGAVSIVKQGTATLTLTGTNSYSGATVVSAGTLVVSATGTLGDSTNVVVAAGTLTLQGSETVTDSAIVWIADGGGAKISLADGVNEAVGRLFFGDKQKGAGVYGATGSGATIINDEHFTGSGVLTVKHGNSGAVLLLR